MQCPIDQTTLTMTSRDGVEIDYCPKCRGVWLDRGELDKIIDRLMGGEEGQEGYEGGPDQGKYRDQRYEDDGRYGHEGGHTGGPGGQSGGGGFEIPRRGDPRGPMEGAPYGGPEERGGERYPPTGSRRKSILDIFNV